MLYLFGIGEIPISISSDPGLPHRLAHTIRFVGRVTDAFKALQPGDEYRCAGTVRPAWPRPRPRAATCSWSPAGWLCPVRPAI